jgi:hypothetical protein
MLPPGGAIACWASLVPQKKAKDNQPKKQPKLEENVV